MRRNVRRLNREIGHHAASLSNPTAIIPLSVPSSYQPRNLIEKQKKLKSEDGLINEAITSNTTITADNTMNTIPTAATELDNHQPSAAEIAVASIVAPVTTALPNRKSSLPKKYNPDGTIKKKGLRKAVNLSGI